MEIKDIDWNKCAEIANKTGESDEYGGMAWGSPEEIDYICDCLWAFKEKQKLEDFNNSLNITQIFGIPLSRLSERFDLFMEKNFNLRNDKDWKEIKKNIFFHKVEVAE